MAGGGPGRLRLYVETLRHLKARQFAGRALHVFRARFGAPPSDAPAPALRRQGGAFATPVAPPQSQIGPSRFRFLNHEADVPDAAGWNDPAQAKLWLYNLHYFSDLTAVGAAGRHDWHEALIARWIAENPPAAGNGWEPYPTSLRIVSWIKHRLGGAPSSEAATHSLAMQARRLRARIEWHLLGNHLLANAKALAFAGCHFSGPEADEWRAVGLEILKDQLAEQVLADGGHFERSPMYHAIMTEDVLDLLNLSRAYPGALDALAPALKTAARSMLGWLAAMTHADGRISFFNDGAHGVAAEPADLAAYAARLGVSAPAGPTPGLTHLAASGYARLALGEQVALVDVAPIGPDYLPGHAHADTLSFEWSVAGARAIVNGGVSVYGLGVRRLEERGTAAHSTLTIDGENSSEVWGGFRVARRARVHDVFAHDRDGEIEIGAAHDGYRRLPGRNVHARRWTMTQDALTVADRVDGPFRSAVARFHLGPSVEAEIAADRLSGSLALPGGRRIAWTSTHPARIEASRWNSEFGRTEDTRQLAISLAGPDQVTRFSVER